MKKILNQLCKDTVLDRSLIVLNPNFYFKSTSGTRNDTRKIKANVISYLHSLPQDERVLFANPDTRQLCTYVKIKYFESDFIKTKQPKIPIG